MDAAGLLDVQESLIADARADVDDGGLLRGVERAREPFAPDVQG
jgi:hypothetical protein